MKNPKQEVILDSINDFFEYMNKVSNETIQNIDEKQKDIIIGVFELQVERFKSKL